MNSKKIVTIILVFIVSATVIAFFATNKNKQDSQSRSDNNIAQDNTVDTNSDETNTGDQNQIILDNDVCGQFTKDFIEKATGLSFEGTTSYNHSMENSCQYYTSKGKSNFISLNVAYLNVENQKKGIKFLDNTLTENSKIKMDHFIATNEKGFINGIYLVLNPNAFIRLDRSSTSILSKEKMVDFAVAVSDKVLALKP